MTPSPKPPSRSRAPRMLVALLLLLIIPALAVGPALRSGARLLPQLPVGSAPLALEDPVAAARALDGMNFSTSDRLFPVLTDQLAARAELRAGSLPTWEPHLGAGTALLGGSIAGLLYPPNWLAMLLPPDLAAAPLAMLSLFLAGLGMLLFLRARELRYEAALFGALAMQASLFALANLHDYMKVDAALWTPWMLYGIESMRAGGRRGGPLLALSLGLSLLAGFPPIAMFGLATAGVVVLVRLSSRPQQLFRALGFVVIGLCIGAWQLLPMLEASGESLRQGRGAAAIEGQALPSSTSAALLLPDLFGAPDAPVFGAIEPAAAYLTPVAEKASLEAVNPLEWNLNFGTLALLLALVGLITRPREALLPALLFVFWLGFAQGWAPLTWLYHIPGLNLGGPGRAMAMGWPLMAWLAALGVHALAGEFDAVAKMRSPQTPSNGRPPRLPSLVAGTLGLLAAGAGLVTWTLLSPRELAAPLQELLAARHGLSLAELQELVRASDIVAAATRLGASLAGLVASGLVLVGGVVFARLAAGRLLPGRASLATALALSSALAPRLAADAFEAPAHLVALAALGAALVALALSHGPGGSSSRLPHETWRHSALLLMLAIGLFVETLDVAPPHLRPQHLDGELFPTSPAMAAIADSASRPGAGRVLRLDTSPSGVGDVVELARPNLLAGYGLGDLTPYSVFTPRTLIELVTSLEPEARFRSGIAALHDPAHLDSAVLDLLRVTTILSRAPLDNSALSETLAMPGLHVYHRPGALGEVLLVGQAQVAISDEAALMRLSAPDFAPRDELILAPDSKLPRGAQLEVGNDPSATLSVTRPSASRIDVKVASERGGWLLFTEQFMPDWKVNIDGRDATMLRADHALRALWIEPGEHLVRTWYEPWSLRYGCILMLLALTSLAVLGWRGRRRDQPPVTT